MRKIVAGLLVSVDGVVERPEAWSGPYSSPEVGQTVGALMGGGDTLLLGRTTYETFAASFANAADDNPMAAQMNAFRKVVVSNSLEHPDWQNSTVVSGDVEAAVKSLKEEDGKDILVSGSPTLLNWLVQHGLLDELDLLLCPVVVGHGRRLFEDGGNRVPLQLASSETFGTGVVHLKYRRAG